MVLTSAKAQELSMPSTHNALKAGSPTQVQGRLAEAEACELLISAGHRIIAQNYLCRAGEIDIISVNHYGKLVFTEVRWRSSTEFGGAIATINAQKRSKLIKTAAFFLRQNPHYATFSSRFDVIAFNGKPPHWQHIWLRGAFSAF
jgi:putative endonuclease